ncbi:amidohydrolase [Pectobacterium carotovorum]|uniref:amidohydrolase n=1 Tax=Pectobacterium carotovorum TaxID=554 RepID=UPI0001A44DB5|nr:amidohydrolase [Pectobacterium carotovorum]MDK9421468.1 amidohydrolase [Pectobacterium carotovorum]QLL95577.1 amidohydrolase [Pectobacterium carotovorum]
MKFNVKMLSVTLGLFTSHAFAHTVYENARIYTVNDRQPTASVLVVEQGKIVYVGGNDGAKPFKATATELVDLEGKTVLPGFIESHAHPATVAVMEAGDFVYVDGAATLPQILSQLKAYLAAHPKANYLLAQGFNVASLGLPQGALPTAADLDTVSESVPIVVYDSGMHAGWVNSAALNVARVDANTPDPIPGKHYFERDNKGNPTGFMHESAMHNVVDAQKFNAVENVAEKLQPILKTYHSLGFTAITDVGDTFSTTVAAIARLNEQGKLKVYYQRGYFYDAAKSTEQNIASLKALREKYHQGNLSMNLYKLFMDGTIEMDSGAMYQPYPNGNVVEPFLSQQQINDNVAAALKAGFSVHVHAIGDKAQQSILDAFAANKKINPQLARVIAHNQVFEPQGVQKFAAMKDNLFLQTTPNWAVMYEKDETKTKIGQDAYHHQFLLGQAAREGVAVTFGSDYPANTFDAVNPFSQIYHAIKRGQPNVGYLPPTEAVMTFSQSLQAYTINGAKQLGISDITGSLEKGKNADFIIVDTDIGSVGLEKLKDTKVLATYFKGEKVY